MSVRFSGLLLHAVGFKRADFFQLGNGFVVRHGAGFRIVPHAFPILLLFIESISRKVVQFRELLHHRFVLGSIGELFQTVIPCLDSFIDFPPLLAERFECPLILGEPVYGLLDVGSASGLQVGGKGIEGLLFGSFFQLSVHSLNGFGNLVNTVCIGCA